MAVYEIKDPKPVAASEHIQPRRRDVKPVKPTEAARAVDFLKLPGQQSQEEKERWHQRRASDQAEVEKSAKTLIRLINQHLEMLGIEIHLALFKDEEGYTLDVHDCSGGVVCDKVAEEPIDIDELPNLLQKLKQQAGILIDRQM